MPLIVAAPASGGLLLGEEDAALGSASRRRFECQRVGRAHTIIMMNVDSENRSAHQRGEHFRQQQVGHCGELISAGGMSGDFNAQVP